MNRNDEPRNCADDDLLYILPEWIRVSLELAKDSQFYADLDSVIDPKFRHSGSRY